jgi:hypothetical protein
MLQSALDVCFNNRVFDRIAKVNAMKTKLKLGVACGIAALMVGFNAQAEEKTFSIGGDVELDLTAKNYTDINDDKTTSYYHGGRVKLNATGELKGDNYFVKGVAQPLVPFKQASGDDAIAYDDVYLQMGRSNWDVQIGRFEGFDLFPVGKDTVLEAASDIGHYGTNDARGRKADVIHGALHLKPNDAMNFELGVMGAKNNGTYDKYSAIRPALTYKAGMVTARVGLESVKNDKVDADEVSHNGFAIGAGFDIGGGTLNTSFSRKNAKDDGIDSNSVAINFVQGNWGVGYVGTKQDYAANDAKGNALYGAYSVPLFGSKDASVTFAGSVAKGSNISGEKGADAKVNAVRVRFNYAF